MQVASEELRSVLAFTLEPLFKYNPFFTIYYNPFIRDPRPEVTEKPYYNYVHQVALLLDVIPRRRVRLLIGDEVGLGKTIEAIRIAKYLATLGEARRILIIAPKSLIRQWLVHEIRDLMHIPGRVKRLTKRTFEDVKASLEHPLKEPIVVLASIDLVKRGMLDKHRRGEFSPYYELVASTNWDLLIVDEAHQISFVTAKPTLRARRLAPLCENVKHLLLLSATPSRGTHRDFILRLSLVNPWLKRHVKTFLKDAVRRRLLYDAVSGLTVYRRTKDHVNLLESRKVFTSIKCFMALVRLGEHRKLYDELGYLVSGVIKAIEDRAPGLVKVILLKRAISSPLAFLRTLIRVLEKRADQSTRRSKSAKPRPTDRLLEYRVDMFLEYHLSKVAERLPPDVVSRARTLLERFKILYDEGDPAFKALAYILLSVLENPGLLPRELVGDYIVFTEYRDTVEYLYNKIPEFFRKAGYVDDSSTPASIAERVLKRIEERELLDDRLKKHIPSLIKSMVVLSKGDKKLVLLKISSENQVVIPLIPYLVEAVDEVADASVLKVLLSTDVASEGLNLHYFNIVVNYETPWSPVRREQRIGRVHRLRQRRDCAVVDFVRDTQVDYEFYTKLVLKLIEMVTQKIAVKPLVGLLEILYLERVQPTTTTPVPLVSERSIGLLMVEAYKKYYAERNTSAIDAVYAMLLDKLRKYLEVYSELTPGYEEAVATREYVKDFTGCEDMVCFEKAVRSLYQLLYGPSTAETSRLLVELYNNLVENKHPGEENYAIIVNDDTVEEGYLVVLELVSQGITRYETPVLLLKQRGVWTVHHGIQVLDWIVETARDRGILVIPSNTPVTQTELRTIGELADKYARRLNFWFREKLEKRENTLSSLAGVTERNILRLDWRLKEPVYRVIPVLSRLDEYEKELRELPVELRKWMEEASVNYVEELFNKRGCRTLEKNIGIPTPYDLLLECYEEGAPRRVKVEVKSHLKRVFIAVLTPSETKEAEKDPESYVVCNVAGLESKDPSNWITMCELYGRLPVRKIVEVEEYAVLDFTKYASSSKPEHGLPS